MANIDLTKYGIEGAEIIYNPSYEQLFIDETNPELTGFEKGQLTETGAVNVMTGIYTGRSPKEKFFVMDETSKDTVWWTSEEYKNDNKPVTPEAWKELKKIATEQLNGKKLYVMDTFCGANENSRLKIRFIMEVAWQAHFVKNMFIRPTEEELANYGEPDFVVLNASKAKVENYKELGLNSETAVVHTSTILGGAKDLFTEKTSNLSLESSVVNSLVLGNLTVRPLSYHFRRCQTYRSEEHTSELQSR